MRKVIKGIKPKNKGKKHELLYKLFIAFILISIFSFYLFIQFNNKIVPTLTAMGEIKAKSLVSDIISNSVRDTLKQNSIKSEDFVLYNFNKEKELISWSINTVTINCITEDISIKIIEQLESMGKTGLDVPIGNALGSFSSYIYPYINIKFLPIGTSNINYDKSFTCTGINQINHTVWLNINTVLQIIVPFNSKQIVINRRVILVDNVLKGDVPPNYVNTQPENMLDVLPGGE